MRYEKWHGLGNDFLIVRERDLPTDDPFVVLGEDGRPRLADQAVVAICDRHFGVGADGILVLGESDVADARMLIHNADGSMAEMCGNGIRVAARSLTDRREVEPDADGSFAIETAGGVMRPTVLPDERVRVDMGPVTSEGTDTIDLARTEDAIAGERLDQLELTGRVVSVGNPHFVVQRAHADDHLLHLGPRAEHHERFPDRTNVEFYALDHAHPGHVTMRVWERGVGETLACGTGACAVAYAARIDDGLDGPITVHLPGGDLVVSFDGDRATMTGAAHRVGSGRVSPVDVVAGLPQPAPALRGAAATS